MEQTGVQFASIDQQQQGQIVVPVAHSRPPLPNLPRPDLLIGSRKEYIKYGIPLYEASIKGDWKAAKKILDEKPELVRSSITENCETALHVAASAKRTKRVVDFVENLLKLMKKEDLELQNRSFNTALCLAAAAGNVEMVKILVTENNALLVIQGSQEMMPLYMAALFGHHDVVTYLYEKSQKLNDDGWTTQNRRWLLVKCVETDMFDVALQIVKDRTELACNGDVLGVLARKPDAFSETKSNFSWRKIKSRMMDKFLTPNSIPESSLNTTQDTIPDTTPDTIPDTTPDGPEHGSNGSETISIFSWRKIKSIFAVVGMNVGALEKETEALQLLRIIWKNIAEMPKRHINDIIRGPPDPIKQDDKSTSGKKDQAHQVPKPNSEHTVSIPAGTTMRTTRPRPEGIPDRTYSSRILFVAAEMGNTKFLVELIRQYPDLIWKVNDNNQSVFHIAVKHRHEGIYNLLYEIGSMKDLITPLKDENENNMLHLVGKSAKRKRLQDVSGVALQMQRELLWFKEVEATIPPSYRERKNKDGLTPHELFTKEHKELVVQGEKWMKDTASQCMVVATLITTIVFAAAFTIPGGYNQNDGIPIFYRKVTFMVFVLADAISLFSSSASILMFLSILTSRYAERDFLESLPRKLTLGLATLFLSISAMMVAFSVSFFVLYHKGLIWMPILISFFATMPVWLFAWLQFPLFADVIGSIHGSRYLFRPKKLVLYYENPKF